MPWTPEISSKGEETMEEILKVNHLNVVFDDISGPLTAVYDVNFGLRRGEIMGIIGESGSGKSVTARSVIQLAQVGKRGSISGEILFQGTDLLKLKEKEMCRIRGSRITMVFQEPMTALNPAMTVEEQLSEVLKLHSPGEREKHRERILETLRQVQLPEPEILMKKYPFELSGGLRQRVVIAMAVIGKPDIIIADEPTTALDVTTQAEILSVLKKIAGEMGSAVILITHDLGVVAEIADRVLVMYRGMGVEECRTASLFDEPLHPYSQGLLSSRPSNFNGRYSAIPGTVKQNYGVFKGCPYSDRCPYALETCREKIPPSLSFGGEHRAACWKLCKEGSSE